MIVYKVYFRIHSDLVTKHICRINQFGRLRIVVELHDIMPETSTFSSFPEVDCALLKKREKAQLQLVKYCTLTLT